MANFDIIIIGGGHNGLVAACYLAKAGLKTLVLERRQIVGGGAITEEIHPGFRCSTLDHHAGPLLPQVIKDLDLKRHGLEFIKPEVRALALNPNGQALCLWDDQTRAVNEIKQVSPADAQSYPEFEKSFARIGKVLAPLLTMTPPSIDSPAAAEVWGLGKMGLSFRSLGKLDAYRLLRWGPMAVADLVAEWFETEALRAMIAARGIAGAFAGPWSAGTSTGLLWQAALEGSAAGSAKFARGGMGAVSESLAKAAIRIETDEGKAARVVLKNGDEIAARAVVSNADPRTTLLKLVDPVEFDPSFLSKVQHYRAQGVSAKINLALSGLPSFIGIENGDAQARLSGRIHVGPDIDYLERAFDAAKYGDYSPAPYMDITIPSLTDPTLAPAGAHVMSVQVQYAPFKLKEGDWNSRREEFGDSVMDVLATYAPNIKEMTLARQIITPLDLEQTYGLSGGHIHHGEQTLDQSFTFRPIIGWAQYRTPLKGLYLCGAGTHPGGGITGAPGANAAREIIKDMKHRN